MRDLPAIIIYHIDKGGPRHLIVEEVAAAPDVGGVAAEKIHSEIDRMVADDVLTESLVGDGPVGGKGWLIVTKWMPSTAAKFKERNASVEGGD